MTYNAFIQCYHTKGSGKGDTCAKYSKWSIFDQELNTFSELDMGTYETDDKYKVLKDFANECGWEEYVEDCLFSTYKKDYDFDSLTDEEKWELFLDITEVVFFEKEES